MPSTSGYWANFENTETFKTLWDIFHDTNNTFKLHFSLERLEYRDYFNTRIPNQPKNFNVSYFDLDTLIAEEKRLENYSFRREPISTFIKIYKTTFYNHQSNPHLVYFSDTTSFNDSIPDPNLNPHRFSDILNLSIWEATENRIF